MSNDIEKPVVERVETQKSALPSIVYIIYLASIFTGGLVSIIGVIMAYIAKSKGTVLEKNHFQYQIRTFWIGLLYGLISLILMVVLIGFITAFLTFVWFVVRCLKGFIYYSKNESIENVTTWIW